MPEVGVKKGTQQVYRIYEQEIAVEVKVCETQDLVINGIKESGVSIYLGKHIIKPFIEMRRSIGEDVFMRDIQEYVESNAEGFRSFLDSRKKKAS